MFLYIPVSIPQDVIAT